MGLEALQRKLLPGDLLATDLAELIARIGESVEELRSYVGALRAPPSADQDALFNIRSHTASGCTLGGRVDVHTRPEGRTAVTIEVPLEPLGQPITAG